MYASIARPRSLAATTKHSVHPRSDGRTSSPSAGDANAFGNRSASSRSAARSTHDGVPRSAMRMRAPVSVKLMSLDCR
jgi:hypothetical protein